MKTAAAILNIFAFTVFFCEYAVAMTPPEPAGTRRFLQIYAGQLPTGNSARKPVWEFGYHQTGVI